MKVTLVIEVRSMKAMQGGVLLVLKDGTELWLNETHGAIVVTEDEQTPNRTGIKQESV